MVSDKEINSLLLKFNKIHKSNISARQVKYYTIAETLNRLTEGKANLPTTDYIRHQLYESGLSFDEMYKMSDRFANQLILENSPDDCFSQESQKVLNQSNMPNNTAENTNNENNGENTDDNNNVEEDEGDVEGSEYDAKEGGFNQGGFNEDDFRKMSMSKEQQAADSVRLGRQESFAHREQMAKDASEKQRNEELSNKVKQGTLDADNLEITVDRLERGWGNGEHPYTTGKMYINGQFFCYTIENYDFTYVTGKRNSKDIKLKIDKLKRAFNKIVDSVTQNAKVAIPAGQYVVSNQPTTKYNKTGKVQNLQAIYKYQCVKDQNGNWKPLIKNGHKVFMTSGNQPNGNAIVPRLNATTQDCGFAGILIHGGFNPSFSNGCILIVDEEPKNGVVNEPDKTMLSHSKQVYDKLWNMIQRTQSKGGKITITINADNENVTSKPPQNAILASIK